MGHSVTLAQPCGLQRGLRSAGGGYRGSRPDCHADPDSTSLPHATGALPIPAACLRANLRLLVCRDCEARGAASDESLDGGSVVTNRPGNADSAVAFDYRPGQSIGYLIRDCYRIFSRALEKRIGRHGVRMGQWFFLRELWEEDGLTQRELSNRVGMMEPTTVVAIRGMVESGLVRRVMDKDDRRKRRIHLTAKGRRLKERLLPFAVEVNAIATQGLTTSEIRAFRRLIRRMEQNLIEENDQ